MSQARFNRTGSRVDWAGYTWNPVTGCRHGCPYCYARDVTTNQRTAGAFQNGFEPTFHRERPAAPLQGPVGVRLRFHLRAPDALIRNPRGGGGPKLATPWPCKARTDLDNLAKPVLDVLTNLGWWGDDGQIVDLSVSKVYAQPNEPSRVDVTVWEVA